MVRFTCPTCKAVLQAPPVQAGEKVACPKCGQRILIPNPVKPAAGNKTALGSLLPQLQSQSPAASPSDWSEDVRVTEERHIPRTPHRPLTSHSALPDCEPVDTQVRRRNKGGPMLSRLSGKKKIVVVAVLAVLILMVGTAVSWVLPIRHQRTGKLWEREALKAHLVHASPKEVRRLLGTPDRDANKELMKDPSIKGLRELALRAGMRPEEDPFSEFWVSDDHLIDTWEYYRVTRNPDTGQADAILLILFLYGQVYSVAILTEEGKPGVILLGRIPSP
jgi:DNA-directed RNA polymerase subunit RPC12/RpoP